MNKKIMSLLFIVYCSGTIMNAGDVVNKSTPRSPVASYIIFDYSYNLDKPVYKDPTGKIIPQEVLRNLRKQKGASQSINYTAKIMIWAAAAIGTGAFLGYKAYNYYIAKKQAAELAKKQAEEELAKQAAELAKKQKAVNTVLSCKKSVKKTGKLGIILRKNCQSIKVRK